MHATHRTSLFCAFALALTGAAFAQTTAPVTGTSSSATSGSTLTLVEPPMKGPYTQHDPQVPDPNKPIGARRWHERMGAAVQVGLNGIGGDVAYEVAEHFNVRVGGQYFKYSPSFTSDGAQITSNFRLGFGKASLDWFPFHNGFFISPLLTVGNLIDFRGTVLVPPGSTITLSGKDYYSSNSDPLRGAASIDTRKVSPGLSIGYGNIVPRSTAHWSFPVEFGFYYVAQPRLKVTFTGSACDPTLPAAIACQPALSDAGFQNDLNRFIARNNNNLSYAHFLPIFTFGVGYRF